MKDLGNNVRQYAYPATVERFCDGDTCIVMLDLGFDIFVRRRVRLIDLDSWELGSEHDALARAVAERLSQQWRGHQVTLRLVTRHPDRFGRLRGRIFRGPDNIADLIIRNGDAWASLRGPARRDHDCGLPGNPPRNPIPAESASTNAQGSIL